MKMLVVGVALAALVASPAFAQSYDPDVGTGNIAPPSDDPAYASGVYQGGPDAPYTAYGAVTPFDFPSFAQGSGEHISTARAAAIRRCSTLAQRYTEYTWGDMEIQQYRACMAGHGQVE
jgi:hypothetical protein